MANGMKSGSGEDPFEDVGSDDDSKPEEGKGESVGTTVETESQGSSDRESFGNSGGSNSLPWKYSRENVKSERDMVQFYLQGETKAIESQAEGELEEMLGESVLTFDLREAAYRVALQNHLHDVAEQLREWGYDVE
jgi:hypothetical protein